MSMLLWCRVVVVALGFGMQLAGQVRPLPLLLIHRDLLKPGNEAAYREIEEDTARLMRDALPLASENEVRFPNAYLAAKSLTGPAEVWFLTAWNSMADYERVGSEYEKNAPAPLIAALQANSRKKAALTLEPVSVFATYRRDLSRGEQWSLGQGRFLVITVTKRDGPLQGAAFESADGTRFVVVAAQTRAEADAKSIAAGAETRVFAVRPYWMRPAKEWVGFDPQFWAPWVTTTAR